MIGFLDEKKLKEIEMRCIAASPGPWISYVEGRDHTSGSNFIKTHNVGGGRGMDIEFSGATQEDQDFIANARQDIPLLLDEIRRIQNILNFK